MKFRDIYNILKEVDLKKLELKKNSVSRNGMYVDVLFITKETRDILTKILEIPFLREEYYEFFYNNILKKNFEELPLSVEIIKKVELLKEVCLFYKRNFEVIYPQLNEYSISIKVPEKYSLKEIGKYFENLEKCFTPLLCDSRIEGNFELSNFDTGSKWLDISVKSGKALGIILGLLSLAVNIANGIQDYKLKSLTVEEKVEKLKKEKKENEKNNKNIMELENQINKLENYLLIQEELRKEEYREKAEELYNEFYITISKQDDDEELVTKIEKSLIILSNALSDGAQIRPAIEYKENFDGIDIQKLIAYEEQKQIENKTENY